MRKFTLFIASLFITIGAMAQTLELTFTRGTATATVTTSGIDGAAATIEATAPVANAGTNDGLWNTGGVLASLTDVLCTRTNTSQATEAAPIVYTITITGLTAGQEFATAEYISKAFNGGGAYQNYTEIRHCNFSLLANDVEVGSKTDESIMIANGGEKSIVFEDNIISADENGNLKLTIKIWKGTNNGGCFYGLTKVTLAPKVETIDITYNYQVNGETKITEVVSAAIGNEYPEGSAVLPFGVTATKPSGTVQGDETEMNIEVSVNLPFVPAESFETIEHWYYVNVRDDGPTYMYYDASIEYIKATESTVPTASKDAYTWAFIGNPFDGYKIVNYLASNGYVLSSPVAPTTEQDASQLVRMVTEEGATGNTDWDFVTPTHDGAAANGFYIQHPTVPGYALNRQDYNSAKTVCYWSGRDTGSTFQVVERPMGATAELEALIATIGTVTAGENIGCYTQASVDALNEAIATANSKIEAETVTADDVTALQSAYDALEIVLPEDGKLYTIVSAALNHDYCNGAIVYASTDNKLYWSKNVDATSSNAVFKFTKVDGGYKVTNIHTASNITGFVSYKPSPLDEENTGTVVISTIKGSDRQVRIDVGETTMHTQSDLSAIVNWASNPILSSASAFYINEASTPVHTLTVGEVGYATLVLGFDATIPANVECYKVISSESNWVNLEQVTDVLPAGEAVIVKAAQGTYDFAYTTGGTKSGDNKLEGTLYNKNIDVVAYVLANGANGVGLYKATLNQEENTAFLNNANKVYLPASALTNADGIASYSFNFDWAGTTGIEGVEAEGAQNGKIYDITGREVKAITAPGIYIVNGKKVVK